ncbi:MAG: glycosyltransferase family 39 protein [Deltaproteobacteria bacterium]|nr:glycosyltransferase family 39 protein [Deltaproteobacteria bacterium]
MGIGSFFKGLSTGKKLILITLLGFLARLYVVVSAVTVAEDSLEYLELAGRFAQGNILGGLSVHRPPFYPFLAAAASYIFGDTETGGRVISLIFGTLTIPLVFYLGKLVYDERAGVVAAFFASVHTYMIRYSGDVLTEAMYYFFLALVAIGALKALRERSERWMFAAGLFSLFAYLTKPAGLGFLAVISIWVLFEDPRKIKEDYKKRLRLVFSGWVVFMAPALPYLFFIYARTGRVPFTGTARIPILELLRRMMAGVRVWKALDFIRYFPEAFTYPFFIFFVVWAVRKMREGTKDAERLLLSLLAAYWLVIFVVLPRRRYMVQIMPLALVFSSMGFLSFQAWLLGKAKKAGTLISAALLVLIAAVQLPVGMEPLHAHRLAEKTAGQWFKENVGQGVSVLTYEPVMTFYAGGDYVLIPDRKGRVNLEEAVAYGKGMGAQYMAGYRATLREKIPDFNGGEKRLLTEIKSFGAADKDEFVIYRINE